MNAHPLPVVTLTLVLCFAASGCLTAAPVPGLAQQIPAGEYATLVDLYANLQGDNWAESAGWNDPAAPAWFGVTVSGFQYDTQTGRVLTVGHVTELSLADNGLRGSLPGTISQLSRLQSLEFPFNAVTGPIPPALGALLELQEIGLFANELSGGIPESLGNLLNLEDLTLYGNHLSGPIPESLGNAASLQELDLSGNQLSGGIPESLGKLVNLTRLDLSGNQLSGGVPESLGNLVRLQMLYLFANQLTGALPESLGKLVGLQWFFCDNNQLSGSIPQSLGNLENVLWLDLDANQLSGQIPDSLGNMASLQWVRLDHNQLSGTLPDSLGNLRNLSFANFDHNQLSGSIPQTFVKMESLQVLYLAENQFAGTIPNLSVLAGFGELDITHNCFDLSRPDVSATLQQLLQAGKRVETEPQNTDCAALGVACPADLITPASPGTCAALVEYPTPGTHGGTGNIAVVCEPPSGSEFPVGLTTVHCLATASDGAQANCSFSIQVQDTEPPAIARILASPNVLWPPNHAMVPVAIRVVGTDHCSPTTSKIVSVTSSEPVTASGNGAQAPDWELTGDLALKLRAEHAGKATDRIYSVTVECRDNSGNTTQTLVRVTVPHRQPEK